MQQTQNYKLNLLESTDPFSPAPLNENAQKTEAALAAETAARQALDGRVQGLELHHCAAGWYKGDDAAGGMHIELGFTPRVAFVMMEVYNTWHAMATTGKPTKDGRDGQKFYIQVEEGGFRVGETLNYSAYGYNYIALA